MKWGSRSEVKHRYCGVCHEQIAAHTRICPYCYYAEAFSLEFASVLYPTGMLDDMRGLVVEAQKSGVTRGQMREIEATFDALYELVMTEFAYNDNVVEAVALMSDMLYETTARRARRRAVWIGVVAVVVATILLSSLFVLVC